jgi:hypothetical protein
MAHRPAETGLAAKREGDRFGPQYPGADVCRPGVLDEPGQSAGRDKHSRVEGTEFVHGLAAIGDDRLEHATEGRYLILPNLAVPFGIFLMRQTMLSVPDELIEAARIDGSGEFRTFFQIVLPTMRPSLAAAAIFLFLGQWNDFVYPLVVLRTQDAYTVPVALASLQGVSSTDYGALLTGTLVSVIPVLFLFLFLFLQRHFVAGLLAGSVKQ